VNLTAILNRDADNRLTCEIKTDLASVTAVWDESDAGFEELNNLVVNMEYYLLTALDRAVKDAEKKNGNAS